MKETPVAIVGAGPSGLVLGLSLAQHGIHSTILERDLEIGEDPRGVYLAADAVRILCQLGFQDQLSYIGAEANLVRFHKSDFRNPAFFEIPTRGDWLEQVVPSGIFQIQPRLEAVLKEAIIQSPYCDIYNGCQVRSREVLDDGVIVYYQTTGVEKNIKASWLIGADGKTGIVRKKFLEPTAGVQQVVGIYEYTGTWVAANLKITLPTPETHPELPMWKLKMCSEEVYDLFWPENWHFCNPPGKATAAGRFGPRGARLWRHEFAEPDWDESKDAVALLWQHLTPMITRGADNKGRRFKEVSFPRDCIEVLRCRSFTFTQKVVNKWFDDRTMIIGDAAHVFPPFGGQGIACGIGDADSLAWRLALLEHCNTTRAIRDDILESWAVERRKAIDASTKLTMMNGTLCNKPDNWIFFMMRQLATLMSYIPGSPTLRSQQLTDERTKYQSVRAAGFFLPHYGGGFKISQVYAKSKAGELLLTDQLLRHSKSVMTIVTLNGNVDDASAARDSLSKVNLPDSILSRDSVISISLQFDDGKRTGKSYQLCSRKELDGKDIREAYSDKNYLNSFPKGAKYAILRPDLIIFASCKTIGELESCMLELKNRLEASECKI